MNKEDILTWLITFGREWVDIARLHQVYTADQVDPYGNAFWDKIQTMHDTMLITKRTKRHKVELPASKVAGLVHPTHILVEEYRLTPRALYTLNNE